jgi:endopeptidase La
MKNILINILHNEYKIISVLLNDYNKFIMDCYNNNILSINDKNNVIKNLTEIIKELNNTFNNQIKNFNLLDNICDIEIDKYFNFKTNNNINEVIKLFIKWKEMGISEYKNINLDNFSKIIGKIEKITQKYGIDKIKNLLLLSNLHYNKKILENEYIEIINNEFIILNYKKEPFSSISKNINNESKNYIIKFKQINNINEVLLDNCCEIELIIPEIKQHFILNGYFKNDLTGTIIKTSQITRPILFEKKKLFTNELNKIGYINEKFKKSYIKNLNLCQYLSYNSVIFIEKIMNDYDIYLKLSKLVFKNLFNEFINDNSTIKSQFDIIKLFLIGGTDENNNMAGLLFSITKDKKFGSEYISDIIYRNLSYTSQIKLRKLTINIKNELDKLKNINLDNIDMKKQIVVSKNMPPYVKKLAFDKIEEMKTGSSEYYKQKTYLDVLVNFPWINENNKDDIFYNLRHDINKSKLLLDNVKDSLNNSVYGHDECKKVMQELIGKWISNPNSIGKAIGLVGPPGVGKTLIAKALGKALNLPFTQINLGGMEDRCILSGHSYTYSSAQPGLIIRKMIEAGNPRCIMYFDELDKTSTKHGINEIFNVLIHLTDTNTNTNFNDSFFNEITFNLSKVLFVFSYNDTEKVDKILLDRMDKIEVKPYSLYDKLIISKKFLLNEVCHDINFEKTKYEIDDSTIEYIIDNYTMEAGVRELKRKFESIFMKLNLEKYFNPEKEKFIIDKVLIDKLLNKPNFNIKKIHNEDDIGIINGLYATSNGMGGIIPILIYDNHTNNGKFILKLTGSQGKVMKESVSFAFTIAMNLVKEEYREEFRQRCKYGLHIHTPDGATPKDGPSAGSAFTTAFISRILNKKIKKDISMTGEIEINGNITAIGGLVYKLKGAIKAGVKTVFIPKDNEDDYKKIVEKDENIIKELNIILVSHIREIIPLALIEPSNEYFSYNKYFIN